MRRQPGDAGQPRQRFAVDAFERIVAPHLDVKHIVRLAAHQETVADFGDVDDLALEVFLRWGLAIDTGTLPPSGYCVGWRARPIERCSTTLAPDPDDTSGEDLSLNGFQFTTESSPQFLRRWSLPTPAPHWCTGRVEFGWFSRTT